MGANESSANNRQSQQVQGGQQQPAAQQQNRQMSPRSQQLYQQMQQMPQRRPTNHEQYNQLYRQWSKTEDKSNKDADLKNFKIQVSIDKDSVKSQVTEDNRLQISFMVDSNVDCYIRVNACVSEKKNSNNVPEMFFTPNKTDFVQQLRMLPGLKQEIIFGACEFDLTKLAQYELTQNVKDYHPLILSINYSENGKQYAYMCYGVFVVNSTRNITGVRITKQLVLINGIPFQIKDIYGLSEKSGESKGDAVEGQTNMIEMDEEDECSICLTNPKGAIIMPCSHFCVCMDCGLELKNGKHNNCPVCRVHIASLIPYKKK